MSATTCSKCPLSRQIEGNRYECTSVHKLHTPVTRGYWASTPDCDDAIKDYWATVDTEIEALHTPKPSHHISCTYHVKSGLYQVRMQGKTIHQGRTLPVSAIGMEVQNIYR